MNMRLVALQTSIGIDTPPQVVADIKKQIAYAEGILAIGEGRDHKSSPIVYEVDDFIPLQKDCTVALPLMTKYFLDNQVTSAIQWLYPNGFDPILASKVCILASTNKSGDNWNHTIQHLNPNSLVPFFR